MFNTEARSIFDDGEFEILWREKNVIVGGPGVKKPPSNSSNWVHL